MMVISGAAFGATRKIVEDAWIDDSMCTRDGTRLVGSRRRTAEPKRPAGGYSSVHQLSTAVERDGLRHQQHD